MEASATTPSATTGEEVETGWNGYSPTSMQYRVHPADHKSAAGPLILLAPVKEEVPLSRLCRTSGAAVIVVAF